MLESWVSLILHAIKLLLAYMSSGGRSFQDSSICSYFTSGRRIPVSCYSPLKVALTNALYSCVFYGDLYPEGKCYNENVSGKLKLLVQARKMFAYGPTQDYLQEKNCIAFARMGDSIHNPCVVMLSNRQECV